jgi:uncharacterized protein (TIGR03437 family)
VTHVRSLSGWLLLAASIGTAWSQAPQFTISTVAGTGKAAEAGDAGPAASAELCEPRGVTVDSSGNLYIADYCGQTVRKVTPNGIITTVAGNGTAGYSGDGGPATSAELDGPYRVTVDTSGNIYIPDSSNSVIRKVAADGTISTVAGNGFSGYSGDGGLATNAELNYPEAVAFDSAGNYYIADEAANVIRKVDINGVITTYAGTGNSNYTGDGGPAISATLDGPVGIAMDSVGDLYISDQGNDVIRQVNPGGVIATVAGTGRSGFSGDGGPAAAAQFDSPASINLDSSGNLYIPDVGNNRIRVVLTSGTIWTVAGDGIGGYAGDGGPALSAEIYAPRGVAAAPNGDVYIADFSNNRVRQLTPLLQTPVISSGGVVSASAFGEFPAVAPGSWIEIYGSNLAIDTRSWEGSDFKGDDAPISLDGTSVTIGGQNAFVSFISPNQVNVQVPNVATGLQPLVVQTGAGASASYEVTVNALEPGFLAPALFKLGGVPYVAALFPDGTYVLPTGAISGIDSRPAQPGDTILMYGVGFGPVTPGIPWGQIEPDTNMLASSFNLSIGGATATLQYDGLAPNYIGLYQFNVVVPSIPTTSPAAITYTLGGSAGTQTLYLAVGN